MSRPIQTRRPVVEPVETRPRRRRKAQIAGVMAAALVISWGGPAASAYWQTLGSNPGGAKADSILAVAAPTASASAVSWGQSTTTAGRPVSGYTVARYSSATGGTKVAAGGACTGTITALSCSEAALPAGTWYYTVTPVLASWAGVESARSGGVAGTPVASPTISTPTIINIATADKVQVSGTAIAGLSVTVTATDAGGVQKISQPANATGGQWTVSNFNLTGLADGTITYTAVATDAVGNASAPGTAASTTKDTVAPAVAVGGVTLANGSGNAKAGKVDTGDKVTIKYTKALDLASICSDWTNSGSLVVTITSNNSLSATGGCPTLRFGAVALGASYYGSGNLQFSGSSLAWDQSTLQLTVTLGTVSNGSPGTATQQTSTPVYTPQAGLTDIAGNPLPVGAVAGTNSKF